MTLRPLGHGSRVLLAAACLGALCVTLTAQQPPPPRFKTGVEITPVDVTVLDERRRPIRGLTARDFVVRVDGEIQRIAAFHEVEIPGADKATAEWTRGAPSDVASNTIEEPRLFVILMDDVAVPFRAYERNKAKELAHRIIDNLGPRDLQGPLDTVRGHGGLSMLSTRSVQIHTLSRESGGRAVVETNAPERVVEDMFREQGSYYQLAYEQSYDLDGRYRRLQIEVKRPNATIVPRELMFVTPDPTKKTQRATVPTGVSSGLTAAISSAVSTGALPLRLAAVPVADPDPDSRTAAVALTLAVMLAPQPEAMDQEIATELLLFDGEGRKQVLRKAQSAKITAASAGGEREIATRLDLPPGRYNVRIAAARSGDQVTGSVYTTFTVPDFQRDALSLSGVAIGRAGGAAIGGREALVDVLPFAPTSIRDFARTDAVGALMRVYQSSRRPARQVTVVTRVIDEMGKEMLAQSSVYEAARFAAGKGVGHRFELPLATLEPGDYLLTFVASTGEGGAQAQREVRFAVR